TGRWPDPRIAAYIVGEVARGLDYAHKKTDSEGRPLFIVHRDVSPQNVVVSWTGEVKILDFGIARSRGRNFETQSGTIKGKYSYMSPEQANGQPVDRRSDVFSLGAVLYELAVHARAFPDPGPASLVKVRKGDYVPADHANPSIPTALVQVIRRAMAINP